MGRATRWLKSLLTGKKENSRRSQKDHPTYVPPEKEKKRWSFTKSSNADRSCAAPAINAAWIRSVEREQSKHAIAVAAATAAAADAAVAAAQAAVAVVRLTRHGIGSDRLAAVKIQTAFRGFLAKKALRALKALVKLQALVRGYLVRKQAAATLHSMQALIRAQAAVRMQRLRPRRSVEEARSEHTGSFHSRRLSNTMDTSFNDESPKIVEVDPGRPRSRGRRSDSEEAHSSPLARLRVPLPQEPEWCLTGDECRFSTAQSTPRLMCYPGLLPSGLPVTPAKSACGGRQHGYMAYTKSSIAKARSQSAPKQRPEPKGRRMTLTEIMEARASLSGVRMQRTCSRAQEAVSFKNTIMGRFDRSSELKENLNYYEKDYYYNSQRKW